MTTLQTVETSAASAPEPGGPAVSPPRETILTRLKRRRFLAVVVVIATLIAELGFRFEAFTTTEKP